MNCELAAGKPSSRSLDLAAYSTLAGVMIRIASRLGVKRVPKQVQSLEQYLHSLQSQKSVHGSDNEPEDEIELDAVVDTNNPEGPDNADVPDRAAGGDRE